MSSKDERPITIAILAVGGQGGGVLTQWLVDLAEDNGFIAQSTFVAGVAQRTGATVYCVEMFPKARAEALGEAPVFTPYPVPGDVDLVVVGEMAETGRALQKGFVTPNVTTLVSSSHRLYSITEKEAPGNGIVDQAPVAQAALKASKKFVCFDMDAAANEAGTVISSVLFGAVAGSGALPFERQDFEETIRSAGRGVDANLRGFALGYDRAASEPELHQTEETMQAATPVGSNGKALQKRIEADFPAEIQNVVLHGALRTLDYQDMAYAEVYLDWLQDILGQDSVEERFELSAEVARQLALQMCYEDTIRVAELKTKSDRFVKIREHVAAEQAQPVHVIEYFHPRLEEVCDTLPAALGARIMQSNRLQKLLAPLFRKGRNVTTTNISGYLLMHILAKFRRWRRGSYRFGHQMELIESWLNRIRHAANEDYAYAKSIATAMELVKGYGDTYERGLTRYRAAVEAAESVAATERAPTLRRLYDAALADEQGQLFDSTLNSLVVSK